MSQQVSVAMCTYNGEPYIYDQMQSILNQTLRPSEIIICDDYSTDHTLKIMNGFKDKSEIPIHIYQRKSNGDMSSNFEFAIKRCQGDFIATCDQDDIWLSHKLATHMSAFNHDPLLGLTFANAWLIDDVGNALFGDLWRSIGFKYNQVDGYSELLLKKNVVSGMSIVFKKSCLDYCLPIPTGVMHDAWLPFLISIASTIKAIPKKLVLYRQHSNNLIGAGKNKPLLSIIFRSHLSASGYLKAIDYCHLLHSEIIRRFSNTNSIQGILYKIHQKQIHFNTRLHYPESFLKKCWHILKELRTGRYHRFSYSSWLLSSLKDLWGTYYFPF